MIRLESETKIQVVVTCDLCQFQESVEYIRKGMAVTGVNKALSEKGWKYDFEGSRDICPNCQRGEA